MMENNPTPIKTRDVVVTRIFNAPIALVWKAWTEEEHVKKWWGPSGFTSPLARLDFRQGGTSLVCMRASPEFGGQDFYNMWTYTKIVPLERIEFLQNLCDAQGNPQDPVQLGLPPEFPKDVRTVVTFKSLSERQTELSVSEYGMPDTQLYEFAVLGLNQSLDKMAASFAQL